MKTVNNRSGFSEIVECRQVGRYKQDIKLGKLVFLAIYVNLQFRQRGPGDEKTEESTIPMFSNPSLQYLYGDP